MPASSMSVSPLRMAPADSGSGLYQISGFGGFGGYGGGSGFLGSFDFESIYQDYGVFIDAVLFLLLFLGVGQSVFKAHFKKGGKLVYTSVGLVLTFSLIWWEQRSGITILYELGPLAPMIILLVIFLSLYKFLKVHIGYPVIIITALYFLFYVACESALCPSVIPIGSELLTKIKQIAVFDAIILLGAIWWAVKKHANERANAGIRGRP